MDIEEEILAFGETEVWVECDVCGCAFGGPGVNKAIVAVGHVNVCADCDEDKKVQYEGSQAN
jgi:hypothetical protein